MNDGVRLICFVTGVPGAGKTLAGLAAVHEAGILDGIRAAYLSGNGPLVKVLQGAMIQDGKRRGLKVQEAKRQAQMLVQNVHAFVLEYGVERRDLPPDEHVTIFDEAQRAWHQKKLQKRHPSVSMSEPALMLDVMSRPSGWSGLIALVGGGQEIYDGEAGISEWGRALAASPHDWRVLASPEVCKGGSSVVEQQLFDGEPPSNVQFITDSSMHLSVSVRSPRAKQLSDWVNAVLDRDAVRAREHLPTETGFRLGLTRNLATAKSWLRDAARDELRMGLITSSGNLRLRGYGIEVSPEFLNGCSLEHWFLGERGDIRSSHALEIVMTEFKIQGLELDLVGMAWGDDLTLDMDGQWLRRRFRGNKWQNISKPVDRMYLLNKYRVLLTRAREGMVIWVPPGDPQDPTRDPMKLDRVAQFLEESGLPSID